MNYVRGKATSALSIVSTSLKLLSDIKCSFIVTSHLHQLMDISIVKQIQSLNVYHLKIEYDIHLMIILSIKEN